MPPLEQLKLRSTLPGEVAYTDDQFYGARALFHDGPPAGHPSAEDVRWLRPAQVCEAVGAPAPALFVDSSSSSDVVQGALGDCWFLSALGVVALQPELLSRVFSRWEESPAGGKCTFVFHYEGEWRPITIDDRLPCDTNGRLLYARAATVHEMWVPLVEKAYAKLHGSYEALVSGFADTALRHLTGGASQRRTVRASDGAGSAADELWARLTSWTAERSPVGCAHSRAVAQRLRAEAERGGAEGATSAAGGAGGAAGEAPAQQDVPGPDEGVGATGLLRGHAYGLEAVREIAGRRLLRLRNPWGRGEWVGAWADGAEEWTDELLVSLGYQFGDDGTFWMELPDFCTEFNVVYLARLFERRGWDTRTLRGEWRGVSAAGCPGRAAGWRSNPAVSLTLAEDMELFCVLSLGGELPPAVLTSTATPSPVFTSATGRSAPQEVALHPGRAALALVPSSTHANPTSRPAIGFAVAPASVLLRPSRGASLRGVDARLSGLPLRPEAQVSSGEEVRLRAGVYFLVPFTLEPGVQASWRLELCCSNGGALTVGRWVSVDAMAAAVGGGAAAADSEASFNGGCAPAVGMPSTVASPAEARAEEEEGEEDLWWGMETEMDSEEAFGWRASAGGGGSAFLGSREERRLARAAAALSEAYLTQQCDEMRPAWDMSVFRALATGGSPHAIASSDDILSRLALRRQQSHRVALRASTAGTPLLPRAVPSVSVRELPDEILKGAAEAVRRAKAELAQKRSPGGEGPRRRGAMPLPWDSAQPPHRTARTSAVRSADGSRRRHTSVAPHTPQAVWPGTYPLAGRGDGAGGRSAGSRRLPLPVPHWGAL